MDYGSKFELITPRGTLTFNDWAASSGLILQSVSGLDGAPVRGTHEPVPQRDAEVIYDFYRGALTPVLEGLILTGSYSDRRKREDDLRGHTHSILRADGTLRWIRPSRLTDVASGYGALAHYRLDDPVAAHLRDEIASRHGTYTGTGFTLRSTPLASDGFSVTFGGTGRGDVPSAVAPNPTTAMTVVFWIDGTTQAAQLTPLLDKRQAVGAGWGVTSGITANPDKVSLRIDTTAELDQARYIGPVLDGNEHWVGFTIDAAGNNKGYIDGVEVAVTGGGGSPSLPTYNPGAGVGNSEPLFIGGDGDASGEFVGKLDEVLVFPSALTAAQMLDLYRQSRSSRRLTVRLLEALQLSGDNVKKFQLALIAASPFFYSDDEWSISTTALTTSGGDFGPFPISMPPEINFGDFSGGGATTAHNAGNAPTYPRVRIFGPVSGPTLRNTTTGKLITLPGLVISTGDFVEIDMQRETVLLNASEENSVIGKLDAATSDFWPLEPGDNGVKLSGSSFEATTLVTLYWRDAFA